MQFSLFQKSEKISLLLHIDGNGVSAGFVISIKNQKPKIRYGKFLPFGAGKTQKRIYDTLDKMLEYARSSENRHISSILISFASPLFYSKVEKIEIHKDKFFIISRNFLNSISEYEKHRFENDLSVSTRQENGSGFVSIENFFTDFYINGYSVTDCINQKTKNLSSSLYISAIPESISKDIGLLVSKYFPSVYSIKMHSFSFISFAVCQNIFPALANLLLLNVTAETTDVIWVLNKSISKTASFPSGRNFIIRQIAKKFDVSSEIAESYLYMRNSKTADDDLMSKIQTVLDDIETEWLIYLENILAEMSRSTASLSDICLIAKDDAASLYLDFLKNQKNNKEFLKNAKFFCLNRQTLSDKYDATNCDPDIFLSMMAVFNTMLIAN